MVYYPVVKPPAKRRIYEFDILRGLFIFIIIVDHLQFWPSPLSFITGEGRLWVSAAEGFFLISGLLVGYIRAYKDRHKPLLDISKKLLKRAFLLYVWGVGITITVTGFTLLVGGHELLPKLPSHEQLASPLNFFGAVVTMSFFNDWIYFLRMYAIMLAVTPLFLWMLRHNYERVIIILMLASYIIGFALPEKTLQWQVFFFGAALLGYKLESVSGWFSHHRGAKYITTTLLIGSTIITMVLSYFFVLGWWLVDNPSWHLISLDHYIAIRTVIDPWFTNTPMTPTRIALSFLWIGGLFMLVHMLRRHIMRFFGWLLIPFGNRSLSVYCLQALLLPIIAVSLPVGDAFYNTIVTLSTVLLCWALIRVPLVKQILPV